MLFFKKNATICQKNFLVEFIGLSILYKSYDFEN